MPIERVLRIANFAANKRNTPERKKILIEEIRIMQKQKKKPTNKDIAKVLIEHFGAERLEIVGVLVETFEMDKDAATKLDKQIRGKY